MKYLGWVSLLSCNAGWLLGLVVLKIRSRRRDTSGFAGLGETLVFIAIVFASALVGTITGAMALKSGITSLPVIIGFTTSLLVVCVFVLLVFWLLLND